MLRFNSSLLIYLWAGHESCFCRSWWWQFNHCSNGPNKPSILSYLTTRGSFVLLRTSPTNTNNERHHIQQSAGYFHSEESETKRWQKKTRMYRSFKWPESNQWTCLIWLHQPNLLAKNFIEKKMDVRLPSAGKSAKLWLDKNETSVNDERGLNWANVFHQQITRMRGELVRMKDAQMSH